MLNDYKDTYRECANFINGWENLSTFEAAIKYIEYKDSNKILSESYLSAFICLQWGRILDLYYRHKFRNIYDCYDIFIESVLYILNNHVWTNEDSKLYQDPDAVDKALAIVIKYKNIRYFEEKNRDIRKINDIAVSFDYLLDEFNHDLSLGDKDPIRYEPIYINDTTYNEYKLLVEKFFKDKNYFAAYLIDLLMMGYGYEDSSKEVKESKLGSHYKKSIGFNRNLLIRALRNLDEEYCLYFSSEYNVSFREVLDSRKYINNITKDRMYRNVINTISRLKKELS